MTTTADVNRPGMRGAEPLEGAALAECREAWKNAALAAAAYAELMDHHGAHKQNVNRVLEPFTHINVVVTATEWDNFFRLRLDRAAQPDMRALAVAMRGAMKASEPKLLRPGEWHLPFIEFEDQVETLEMVDTVTAAEQLRIKVSVARVARVSYESFVTGKRSTIEEDLKLHDMLLISKHLSPFEHQATPDEQLVHAPYWKNINEHGNFWGWRQNRKLIKGEAVAPLPEEYR